MKIAYAGPKPIISDHGISFKEGKEDKYSYLKASLQILNAIDHEYDQNIVYSYDIVYKELSQNEMLAIILKFHPDVEDVMNKELDEYKEHLQKEKDDIINHSTLQKENKEVFLNNLRLMEDYRIQRIKNKFFYKHVIETIKEQIIEHKIKVLKAPFHERFWHVFQTIQGELTSSKSSITTTLEIEQKEPLTIKMNILNNI